MDYFLGRLERAQRPFAAVYYSYVPHFPYRDHGDAYAVFPNAETPRHRYYNNLRLLDTQIRRIMDALRQSGTLDDTIVLFIGDHGEAFGQHAGNHIHLNFSYEENVRPLAVLFQPRLFRPSVETRYTSHVDVLPTLLDAVCVPYEPRLLQGHSLLAGWDRRAIYLYGSEHSVTSISKDGLKVTTDHRSGQAWAYDLRADPEEKHRLGISVEHPQVRANLQLYLFQAQMLPAYNESARNGRAFHGLRHPLQ